MSPGLHLPIGRTKLRRPAPFKKQLRPVKMPRDNSPGEGPAEIRLMPVLPELALRQAPKPQVVAGTGAFQVVEEGDDLSIAV